MRASFLDTDFPARTRAALDAGALPQVDRGGDVPRRRAGRTPRQGGVHRAQLRRSRRGDGDTAPCRTGRLHEGRQHGRRPRDTVLVPRTSEKTDYEIELAVVIGRTARYLDSPEAADDVIAGYAIADDVSERAFQHERGGQWDKGKSCETFNPLGPWLVTPDETGDPQDLAMRLWVNGELRQDGTPQNMIFGVAHIVWYLSQFMVLDPGDVIITGTPAGVALSGTIPLPEHGDVVEERNRPARSPPTVGQA